MPTPVLQDAERETLTKVCSIGMTQAAGASS